MLAALCVLLALALDRGLGEPPARLHPVVWMGHWLGWFSRWLPTLPAKAGFCAGTLAWLLGALGVLALALALHTWVLRPLAVQQPALAVLLGAVLLKPLLAWRMLREEVRAVDAALAQSVPAGRQQLARLVSRDTSQLSPAAVREAAIETLAENLNDSVVAPLFWFAVAGLPGAALYRYANTADAMWGYRGRWEWAGKCAARVDDALSWLPARLTALLLCLAAWQWPGWRPLRGQAQRTPSPNGGWPMGAMALLLGCQLGKPGVYALNAGAPAPGAPEHALALQWAGRAVGCLALLAAGLACAALLLNAVQNAPLFKASA